MTVTRRLHAFDLRVVWLRHRRTRHSGVIRFQRDHNLGKDKKNNNLLPELVEPLPIRLPPRHWD